MNLTSLYFSINQSLLFLPSACQRSWCRRPWNYYLTSPSPNWSKIALHDQFGAITRTIAHRKTRPKTEWRRTFKGHLHSRFLLAFWCVSVINIFFNLVFLGSFFLASWLPLHWSTCLVASLTFFQMYSFVLWLTSSWHFVSNT
jgi:hypothetical protein